MSGLLVFLSRVADGLGLCPFYRKLHRLNHYRLRDGSITIMYPLRPDSV